MRQRVLVALADRHVAARLVELSSDRPDLDVRAVDAGRLHAVIASERPSAVLADVELLDAEEGRDLRGLRESPAPPEIILRAPSFPSGFLSRMLQDGAAGVVWRSATPEELLDAVARVLRGETSLPPELVSQLAGDFLRTDTEQREIRARFEFAAESLSAQLSELHDTYRATVEALAAAVELRDEYTGGHIVRVREYSLALARDVDPSLADEGHAFAYMLHDIGKLAIPDSVLLKPGRLTPEEFDVIKLHTTAGAHFLEGIPFLRDMAPLVRNHHERWDGAGYPDGLHGERIPLIARIFAVADTLDAMTTDRPYRSALPLQTAVEEIERCAGTQFDPAAVEALGRVLPQDEAFAELRAGATPGRDRLPGPLRQALAAIRQQHLEGAQTGSRRSGRGRAANG